VHPPSGGAKDPLKRGAPSGEGQLGIKKPRSNPAEKAPVQHQESVREIQKDHLRLAHRKEEKGDLKEDRLVKREEKLRIERDRLQLEERKLERELGERKAQREFEMEKLQMQMKLQLEEMEIRRLELQAKLKGL
jgi:hypothetical protein